MTHFRQIRLWALFVICAGCLNAISQTSSQNQTEEFQDRIQGDVGLAVYSSSGFTQGNASSTHVLPYAYFDYGRFFARIDTFGIKTIPLGTGYLEFIGRYSQDNFVPKGNPYSLLSTKESPLPIGLGTFQLTPIGAFFVYGFEDITASKGGKVAEFTYATQIDLPLGVKVYPLIGFDYKDKTYLNYFYGVSSIDSQRTGLPLYSPNTGVSPFAAMVIEVPLSNNWVFNTYFKQKWLATTIADSPLVTNRRIDNFFISMNYHFE